MKITNIINNHTQLMSIGTNTHAQIDSKLGYALPFGVLAAVPPADGQTYYIGLNTTLVTAQGVKKLYCPFTGTVTAIYGEFVQVVGTNEASTLSLLHNGLNDTVISNTLDHSASLTPFSKTDIAQAVAAGDYLELKWITPTWATNPTTVRLNATVWIRT